MCVACLPGRQSPVVGDADERASLIIPQRVECMQHAVEVSRAWHPEAIVVVVVQVVEGVGGAVAVDLQWQAAHIEQQLLQRQRRHICV